MRASDGVVELVEDVEGAHVLVHLLDAARAGDHRRHVRVAPRTRRWPAATACSRARRRRPFSSRTLALRSASVSCSAQPLVAGKRGAAALGDAVEVLAGQQARGERAPRREPEADVVVEPGVLALDAPRSNRLYCGCSIDGLVQVVALGDLPRGTDLVGASTPTCPSRAPCPLAMMSDIAHTVSSMGVLGSARWQNRRSTKSSPNRSSEPSMACIRYLRLSVLLHVRRVVDAPEHLRRDHVRLARPAELGDRLAHDPLGLAAGVRPRRCRRSSRPGSRAAARQSRARPVSSWLPKVTHEPNESTLTLRPVRPRRRYAMSMPSL